MAKHLIVMSVVMDEMDGSPEESVEALLYPGNDMEGPYPVLLDYIESGEVEITAEEFHDLDFLNDDGTLL